MTAAMQHHVPASDGWTTDDLDALPEDGIRRELLDGVLMVPPSPSDTHQLLAALLTASLHRGCPPAFAVTQAVDVRLSKQRSFSPDVLVISAEARQRDTHWFHPHEVVVAVEIVSPSSVAMDGVTKPALYAAAGIPHYWRIETKPDLVAYTYKIDPVARVYRGTDTFTDVIDLDEPWPIKLPLADLTGRDTSG